MRSLSAAALAILGGSLLAAQAQTTNTQTLDFPAGGALRLNRSIGELTIEGWNEPRVAIETVKSIKPGYEEEDARKWLNRVRVTARRQGNAIVVDTVYPKHFLLARPFRGGMSPIQLQYRIKAPRNARVEIEHQSGEVHIQLMNGDIRATNGRGELTIYAPSTAQYAIDARSKVGAIDSDFAGRQRLKLVDGHAFVRTAPAGTHKLYLRIGFGDIIVLKEQEPAIPSARTQK
ncbi:MAG TPA: hypothetical protein VH639_15715 [Bryobacteraceae bacterium]|jgi:hypothetical protein